MKRCYLAFAAVLLLATSASAQFRYGWTISKSNTDPFVNTGAPTGGVDNLYLWLQCTTTDGISAADFVITTTGGFTLLAFNPQAPFLNAGSGSNLLLAAGGCPTGPILAGSFLTLHSTAGTMCFTQGSTYPTPVAVDCASSPEAHECDFIGYDDGGNPCSHFVSGTVLCGTVSVEDTSWGSIKGLYR